MATTQRKLWRHNEVALLPLQLRTVRFHKYYVGIVKQYAAFFDFDSTVCLEWYKPGFLPPPVTRMMHW